MTVGGCSRFYSELRGYVGSSTDSRKNSSGIGPETKLSRHFSCLPLLSLPMNDEQIYPAAKIVSDTASSDKSTCDTQSSPNIQSRGCISRAGRGAFVLVHHPLLLKRGAVVSIARLLEEAAFAQGGDPLYFRRDQQGIFPTTAVRLRAARQGYRGPARKLVYGRARTTRNRSGRPSRDIKYATG